MTVDFLDIVATQGAYLLPEPPPTPVYERRDHGAFAAELCQRLNLIITITQPCREAKYGAEAAAEWPIGHTPPELVEKRRQYVEQLVAQWGATSPSECSDEDYSHIGTGTGAGLVKGKHDLGEQQASTGTPAQRQQLHRLPTPLPSRDSATSRKLRVAKRRRDYEPGDEEEEKGHRPAKTRPVAKTRTRARRRPHGAEPRRSARLAGRSVDANT